MNVFKRLNSVFLVGCIGTLSACAGMHSDPIIDLDDVTQESLYIDSVAIRGGTQHFQESLQTRLAELPTRDRPRGRPVRLEITIEALQQGSAALNVLVGGANELDSVIRLRDVTSGRLVYETRYKEQARHAPSGILAAIVQLATDEEAMFAKMLTDFLKERVLKRGVDVSVTARRNVKRVEPNYRAPQVAVAAPTPRQTAVAMVPGDAVLSPEPAVATVTSSRAPIDAPVEGYTAVTNASSIMFLDNFQRR